MNAACAKSVANFSELPAVTGIIQIRFDLTGSLLLHGIRAMCRAALSPTSLKTSASAATIFTLRNFKPIHAHAADDALTLCEFTVLNAIVKNTYKNDPAKLAEWATASHVEKHTPVPRVKPQAGDTTATASIIKIQKHERPSACRVGVTTKTENGGRFFTFLSTEIDWTEI